MGNQDPIPDSRSDHAQLDGDAMTSSVRVSAGRLESRVTITLRIAKDHVPESVRRKLARCLRQALPLVESVTDDSEMDEEPDHGKKMKKALKSGTVIRRITWPHELIYISGGEAVTYELISILQFVSGYLSVLDMVNTGEKQVMLKHF